ncbi:TetR/AcrR family transcriptional regulator [Bradyrhizobium sp. USDA 3315]
MSTKKKPPRDRRPTGTGIQPSVRRRLPPKARSEMILNAAISFFAERGFDGQLKDLAEMIGVSQALIFSYFGSKQVLIERVYEKVYVARWKTSWYDTLIDQTKPLEQRLNEYYKDYLAAIDEPIWIRIVLYSGLAGNELTHRYVSGRVEKLLRVIVSEIYKTFRFSKRDFPESELYEAVWDVQASFLYGLVRKHVWKLPVMANSDHLVELRIRHFIEALRARELAAIGSNGASSRLRGTHGKFAGAGASSK